MGAACGSTFRLERAACAKSIPNLPRLRVAGLFPSTYDAFQSETATNSIELMFLLQAFEHIKLNLHEV